MSIDNLWQDVRYALRSYAKAPSFTLAVLTTLALGIGASTAIFSFVDGILIRPLPLPDPNRLAFVNEVNAQGNPMSVSWPDFLDWRARQHSFDALAISRGEPLTLTGADRPRRLSGRRVTANFFRAIGIQPAMGPGFADADDQAGATLVVIVSDAFWREVLGADPGAIGRSIALDSRPHTVVGVLPRGFQYLRPCDACVTMATLADNKYLLDRGNHQGYTALGRLKPGVTLATADRELQTIPADLRREHPDTNTGVNAHAELLADRVVANVRQTLLVLLGAVGCLLLIACVNVANLLITRGAARDEKICDVHARDEQQAADRAEEHEQRLPYVGDHAIGQQFRVRIDPGVRVRMLAPEVRGNRLQLAIGCGQRNAGLQPPERGVALMIAAIEQVLVIGERRHRDTCVARTEILKTARQHADDGVRATVERDRTADRTWIGAEHLSPECVADDYDQRRAGLVVRVGEPRSHGRLDADRPEEIGGDAPPAQPPRSVGAGERERLSAGNRKRVERMLTRAPVEKVRPRHRHRVALRVHLVDERQAVRIGQRQRPDEDAVHEREDRRRRADAERERRQHGEREGRRLRVGPQRVSHVLPQIVDRHRCSPPCRVLRFGTGRSPPAVPHRQRQRLPPVPPRPGRVVASAQLFEQVAGDGVPARAGWQRAAQQPSREARRRPVRHDGRSFSRRASPCHMRRSTSREARKAVRPAGVTVYKRRAMPSRAGVPATRFQRSSPLFSRRSSDV